MVPSITFPEESEQAFNVTEGDNITCTATGYPEPDIVWLNNDGSVVDKSRVVTGSVMAADVGNVSSVSVSMIVGRTDSGVYKCLATNSVGNDASTISIVTIQCKLSIVAITYLGIIHMFFCLQQFLSST